MLKKTGFLKRSRGYEVHKGLILGGHNLPTDISFTFAINGTQYGTECEIAVLNAEGQVIPGVHALDVYLTDAADGTGVTATDPAGAITAKADSGTVLGVLTAKKAFRVITLPTGKFTLQILDDVTPVLLYVAASIPTIGVVKVSRKTVAGDYKP